MGGLWGPVFDLASAAYWLGTAFHWSLRGARCLVVVFVDAVYACQCFHTSVGRRIDLVDMSQQASLFTDIDYTYMYTA